MSSTGVASDQNQSNSNIPQVAPRSIVFSPRTVRLDRPQQPQHSQKPERRQIGNRRKVGINISMTMGMMGAIDVIAARFGDNRSGIATKAITEYLQKPEIKALLQEFTTPQKQQEAQAQPYGQPQPSSSIIQQESQQTGDSL